MKKRYTIPFYLLNYTEDIEGTKFIVYSPERELISYKLHDLLQVTLYNKTKICTYIYSYDIGKLYDHIKKDFILEDINIFKYKNTFYSIEINDILYPKRKIIIKDLYNIFVKDTITKNETQDYDYLNIISKELENNYNINMHSKYILSTASLSLRIFKKKYASKYKCIRQLTKKEDEYIRKSYYGGRNEIFVHSAEEHYYYDVNSSYPFIMKTHKMPTERPRYRNQDYFEQNPFTKDSTFFGYIDVLIECPKTSGKTIPVLPYRMGKDYPDTGIIYPEGVFRGVYFTEEIKLALSQGYIIHKTLSGYQYKTSMILFDEYIDEIYQKRKTSTHKILNHFYKMIMNTLYGRFGMIHRKAENQLYKDKDNNNNDDIYVDHNGNEYIMQTARTIYNNIALSSAITSYARKYMYEIIRNNKAQMIYIDTDGIFVKEQLTDNIITEQKELGKLRLESKNKAGYFMGNKFYIYYDENGQYTYKFKGIPKINKVKDIKEIIETHKMVIKNTIAAKQVIINIRMNDGIIKSYKMTRKRKVINEKETQPWLIMIKREE